MSPPWGLEPRVSSQKKDIALKHIQLLVSLYVILPAASLPYSHGFLHSVNYH